MHTILAALQAADAAYCEEPTPENNRAIVLAQRAYYKALRPHSNPMRRARNMVQRAQQNRKREKGNPAWQQMAYHQYVRAKHLYLRLRALQSLNPPPKATPGPKRYRPQRTKRTRTIHPITRRYVYSD